MTEPVTPDDDDARRRERLRARVDPARVTATLAELARRRSFSNTPGELELTHWVAQMLGREGLQTELRSAGGDRVNVLARVPGRGGGPTLMLNGHLDTNMPGLGWTRDPLGGAVEDGYLYGIGVSNMKAAIAAMIEAALALRDAEIELLGDLVLAFVVGELQGGVGTVALIEGGIDPDYFIVGEPTDLHVMSMHSGSVECEIVVDGVTRHMSRASEGVSAISKMVTIVAELESADLTVPSAGGFLRRLNIGSIRGGVGEEYQDWRPPLVPDRCIVRLALRYEPGQTPDDAVGWVRSRLEKLSAADPDLHWRLTRVADDTKLAMPAFEARDPDFAELVASLARHAAGRELQLGAVEPYCWYGTDAGHLGTRTSAAGVVCGPGGMFNSMPDERVALGDVVAAAETYALVALDRCGAAIGEVDA